VAIELFKNSIGLDLRITAEVPLPKRQGSNDSKKVK